MSTRNAYSDASLPYHAALAEPANTIIGGASLWFMAGRSDDEYRAAADFIDHLSSPEVQARWHQDTGYLPLTPAAHELTRDEGFYAREPGVEVAVAQMLGRTPTVSSRGVRLGNFVEIREVIGEALESVWTGGESADVALGRAVVRGDELLREFERGAVR